MAKTDKKPIQTNPFFAWQESKVGLIFIIIFDLLFAYVIGLSALDTGSLIQWTIVIVFLLLAIVQAVKLIKKVLKRG
jgi:membrane protein YdbS with pleckstrin-like domain